LANLADHLFRQAEERGSKCALYYEKDTYSFAEIADRVRCIAGGLATANIGIGSHVGLLITARPEFIFFQQALFALGATVTPLNIFYRRNDLLHAIQSCALDCIILGPEFLGVLPACTAEGAETLKRVILVTDTPDADDPRQVAADRLIEAGIPIDRLVELPPTAISMILNTSATTGKAKGVMLSLGNIRANYDHTPDWLGLTASTVTLCALPLYNTFGLNQCVNALMVTGASMVLMPRFDAVRCIEAIETHRCNFFPAVPTMLQKLIDHPDAKKHDLSSISRIMTGGAPVPAALIERICETFRRDTVVITGYGLTEGTALASIEMIELDADGKIRRPKSIGKPVPGVEMRIFAEDGREAATGEVGEICMRGPHVMQGYYKRPDDTALALAGGWLHTGDLGVVDDDGHFYVVDRKKDVIIRGGQNIYPTDIEEVLYGLPGVSEAAVIGVAHDVLGEVPWAYVALKPGTTLSAADLIAHCKEELASYQVPAALHILPELPKGPTGKILRRHLRPA